MKQNQTIQGWVPISLNKFLRMHWSKRNRQLKADYAIIKISCSDLKPAKGHRTLNVSFTGTRCDPDNLLKILLDGLVHCKVLVDDSPEFLTLGSVTASTAGTPGTHLELIDTEEQKTDVALARTGDEAAILKLWESVRPLVIREANKARQNRPDLDVGDLLQESFFAVWDAIKHYSGQTKFSSFALLCVRRKLKRVLSKNVYQEISQFPEELA